ncbi:hypothetical protein SAMN05216428_102319 [Nitrosospira sp. Nsp11]|uniref:hypothetical protein n=1 Tax=Nitrosospira sp. Nsp11 TaxID=1855338 RepID=UPI00091EF3DA|nr:hypothetical protein [Nitrosospira sp. Nsp11]SHL41181.1 hypothetical protein SAMN05216428_102319 [Nitrosospira sp. Nsp11]
MSIENNGGAAFPGMEEVGNSGDYTTAYNPGMTLRDYFAAKAMQTLLAASFGDRSITFADKLEAVAVDAYRQADALLEARKK